MQECRDRKEDQIAYRAGVQNGGQIVELFSSVQGEGPFIGYRQIFLRLAGCNLQCSYCDTLNNVQKSWRWEKTAGLQDFEIIDNPVEPAEIIKCLDYYSRIPHHSLSLTGGEPLLQVDFLRRFMVLAVNKWPLYLETNGTLPEALSEVINYLTYISMDIKLPGSTGENCFEKHKKFLQIGQQKNIFVKIVVTAETICEEWEEAVNAVSEVSPDIQMIIQPATNQKIPPEILFRRQEYALSRLKKVRIIPQSHVLLNIL